MPQITYALQNLDFEKTVEKILRARELLNCLENENHPARPCHVWFRDFHGVTFTLFHTGSMQVKWKDPKEKEILLKLLEPFLVPTPGENVDVTPVSQNVTVPYPTRKIELYWCAERQIYVLQHQLSETATQRSRVPQKRWRTKSSIWPLLIASLLLVTPFYLPFLFSVFA